LHLGRGDLGHGYPKEDRRGPLTPEDSAPSAITLAQANSRWSCAVGNDQRNWPYAQKPVTVTVLQSLPQWTGTRHWTTGSRQLGPGQLSTGLLGPGQN